MSEDSDPVPEISDALMPNVQQALNELENGVALGLDDAVGAARNRLAAAGVDPNEAEKSARAAHAARNRKAAAADTGDTEQAKAAPPQGRTAPAKSTTEAGAKPAKATPSDKNKT